MMVPVANDDFVQTTLIRDRRQQRVGELKPSLVVSSGKTRPRVFAKTVSFDLGNLETNEKQQERRRRRRRRQQRSNNNICEDRWGSSSDHNSESCSSCLMSMPKRNMSPYTTRKPEPTSPGRITQALLLQTLSDHLPELHFSDDEHNDDLDSSTFSRTPLSKAGKSKPQQQRISQHHQQQRQERYRSPQQQNEDAAALAFDMCLEMSPEIFRLGDEDDEDDDDDSSVSTDCSFF